MDFVSVLFWLAVIGFGLWLVNTKLPMWPWVKTVFNVVAAIFVALWLLRVFGVAIQWPKI